MESFKRFWDGDAFFALKVAETDGITQPWLFFYLKFAGKDVLDQVISQASRAAIPLHMHIVPKALLTNVTCNMDYRSKGILELTVDSQRASVLFRSKRAQAINTYPHMNGKPYTLSNKMTKQLMPKSLTEGVGLLLRCYSSRPCWPSPKKIRKIDRFGKIGRFINIGNFSNVGPHEARTIALPTPLWNLVHPPTHP